MPPSPSARSVRRKQAEDFGRHGETLALWYMRAKGYFLVTRRYKTPAGEIDLVMRRGRQLVFIEVKTRTKSDELGMALAQVNAARIGHAAQHFIMRHKRHAACDLRFDVIFLAPWAWPRHVKNAFQAR